MVRDERGAGRTPANLRREHRPPQCCKGAQGRGAHGLSVVPSTDTSASLRKHAHAPWLQRGSRVRTPRTTRAR